MKEVYFRVRKLNNEAILPRYEHKGDAGMDFFSCGDYVLKPGERCLVRTGLQVEFPEGYELQIRPRSGLALKKGISIVNSPGTVDAGYRGEIGIILINHGEEVFEVKKGDKIAQGVLSEVVRGEIEEVDYLNDSDRGERGFGSSGF